ncbi:phosphoenolpyruvate synthase [Pedobacter yonginense]|uniref:Prodigiosin synthesizing transferase PigC n=1 Tax=Pedobacter yonginense TaxID=651869 RepID=A0A317EH30_9SPHI|nr:phosphoenolpyruvate synthase [Pedobacter yonginense]PWS26120.1 phosphoenolpyruvate synthase [Pedobacter yonginense]
MNTYILDLKKVNKNYIEKVGGKGANLGELKKIKGVLVPDGFCVSTEAFRKIIKETPLIKEFIEDLCLLKTEDRDKIRELSSDIRRAFSIKFLPKDIIEEVTIQVENLGKENAYAVRSSATAEDLPTASFAGQQDTYLNVIGIDKILKRISDCWASLFTERAVIYRIKNGFDHRKVHLSVIVQKMIFSDVAGIMFTADPINSNRKIISIDASFGLGEALVSGLVNADNYKIRDGELIDRSISSKKVEIYPLKNGGVEKFNVEAERQDIQVLTETQVLKLASLGRTIEKHFGCPQDIEWCFADDTFYIVQSRPITTLYPVPQAIDQKNHIYISVGHQQMMTDAMKPLGSSFWLLMTPQNTRVAGGRLFVDVTPMLASPSSRDTVLNTLGKFDPLFKDALITIINRGDFIELLPDSKPESASDQKPVSLPNYQALNNYHPTIVSDLIKVCESSLRALKQNILEKSGSDLFDFILDDIVQLKKDTTNPQSFEVIMTGMNASAWINEKMYEWLGEKNVADVISQSVPNNITSEMGIDLLEVADVIRPYPEVIKYLQNTKKDNFLDEIVHLNGGIEAYEAINSYLEKYGMRCAGEIDITNNRWAEKPIILVPLILNNIKNFKDNVGIEKFEKGRQESFKKEQDLLKKLRLMSEGEQKAKETKQMIDLVRHYAGYREYPKYAIISRYMIYKQAILREAEKLLQERIIHEKEDVYYLNFEELKGVVLAKKLNYEVIIKRKEEYKAFQKLSPPRVITSDGEIINGNYNRENLPIGAIVGLAVSSGIIEGRARVIMKMEDADLEEGDILITTFTDPSWTPLFLSVKGVVTEVGGVMTHGAVIAREYGLPAVVGVDDATKIIKEGQKIRLNGTEGYIEILHE